MKIRLLVLLSLLAPLPLLADGEHPVSMWLVEGDRNRVYLLGSVHLLRKQDHPLPDVIEAAYADAEALVMELDMDDLDPVAIQAETNRIGVLRDGRTLADLMGAGPYADAAETAATLEIPLDLLGSTEPWFAALTVQQLVLTRIGFNPLYGIEMHMAMKASQDGKAIEGLETVEEQLAFLDGLSIDAQREFLLQVLRDGETLETDMDALITAWRNGDTAFLEREMLAEIQASDELYEALLAERNRRWLAAITGLLDDDDDYLVVVGAAHLIGDDGVPALLEARGIRTQQMREGDE